jgi:hypothetical protein
LCLRVVFAFARQTFYRSAAAAAMSAATARPTQQSSATKDSGVGQVQEPMRERVQEHVRNMRDLFASVVDTTLIHGWKAAEDHGEVHVVHVSALTRASFDVGLADWAKWAPDHCDAFNRNRDNRDLPCTLHVTGPDTMAWAPKSRN